MSTCTVDKYLKEKSMHNPYNEQKKQGEKLLKISVRGSQILYQDIKKISMFAEH